MNLDLTFTFSIFKKWLRLTLISLDIDKEWGSTIRLLSVDFTLNETRDWGSSLFYYTKTDYLHKLDIFFINIFLKFK